MCEIPYIHSDINTLVQYASILLDQKKVTTKRKRRQQRRYRSLKQNLKLIWGPSCSVTTSIFSSSLHTLPLSLFFFFLDSWYLSPFHSLCISILPSVPILVLAPSYHSPFPCSFPSFFPVPVLPQSFHAFLVSLTHTAHSISNCSFLLPLSFLISFFFWTFALFLTLIFHSLCFVLCLYCLSNFFIMFLPVIFLLSPLSTLFSFVPCCSTISLPITTLLVFLFSLLSSFFSREHHWNMGQILSAQLCCRPGPLC